MTFPLEVTNPTQILPGDKLEITFIRNGSVLVGNVIDLTHNRLYRNGLRYTSVTLEWGSGSRKSTFDIDSVMGKMGFSVRILSRPTVKPGLGTIVERIEAIPRGSAYIPVRVRHTESIMCANDPVAGYLIIDSKEN